MAEHERLVQGESEMREERESQEIGAADVAPMPDLSPAGGNDPEEEHDGDS